MPVPRPSHSAEAARAAALQAEFNEKKWVWVPDEREGYLAGWVHKEADDNGEIIMAAGGETRTFPLYALSKMNPPKFDRVEDIADLTFLNEASVVHNLRLRYGSGAIYTYSGLFLVAVNPYQNLPLYSDAIIQQYRNKRRDENPPHIFAVAERAWINMGEERENQSILITGESGAGKTESTKKVIQYLAAIATDVHLPSTRSHSRTPTIASSTSFGLSMPPSGLPRGSSFKRGHTIAPSMPSSSHMTAKGRLGLLERQILQANPILESFGNAQTQRNNNSSRFGKFVRITFAPDGSIAGANIDWYLLEKSRVVVRSEAERSFHVFYQLMAGGGDLKEALLLNEGVENYEYLNKSRREVDGVDDRDEWATLKAALDVVGFTLTEQYDLFRIVAAILHIGNITVTSTRSDDAVMPDPSQAERVCHLLGIPVTEFTRAILRPRVLAGREWVSQARTKRQALDELSALCKTLYERSFGFLVDRINRALDRPSSKSTFIGVLDIAGFEIFEINAYEQLLINYTNEKLQQFFNHHMFVLEQEEYAREGIHWDYVNFGLDLQPTIDLIEAGGGVIGVLSCLDEECIMPKATDATFTNKLHYMWSAEISGSDEGHPGRDKYEPSRFDQGFIIQHYAGKVEYRTDGWLEKNKDPLNDNITRVLAASSERYVASLFAEYGDSPPAGSGASNNLFTLGKKRALKKGAFRTVAQRHKEQLSSLMTQLQATQPHFVRCIVPNSTKKPGRIDVPLVLDQLRCNGVLEGIRIARLGYPNRLPFVEFRQRYEILTPGIIPRGYMDGRKACERMTKALELDESIHKIGTSKIFFKAGVLAELEERRDALLFDIFSRLQAVARMWTARRQIKKVLNRAVAIRTIQRNARVYNELREWPWWQLYTKVRPLLAATRSDEELRRKEAELILIKERAERDKQEREALESLKMSLESEKRKIEDELEAERSLTLDKDALLERSKNRQSELEEEVSALQADLDVLDSQLDRALKIQKESDEKHESLRQAFDQAAEHLVRLETEQQNWVRREDEMALQFAKSLEEIETLRVDRDEVQKLCEDLKNLILLHEEDLMRVKGRTETVVAELEGKLTTELRLKTAFKDKSDGYERDARQAKEQLAELARTAAEYSTMIHQKEDEVVHLISQLESLRMDRDHSLKHIMELQGDIDTLTTELEAQKNDRQSGVAVQAKLRDELDVLRGLMETKTSEETRRNEVEKRKEEELAALRRQVINLQESLNDSRRMAVEGQNKLRVELDCSIREYDSMQKSHNSLLERERAAQAQLTKVQATLSDLEKNKRSTDSELQLLRSRQIDSESQLAEAYKAKEGLERHLTTAQAKYRDFEDVVLQLEREKSTHDRLLESTRKQLESESAKRIQLEHSIPSLRIELAKAKDRNVKLDRELNKALTDLKAREWEVKQLESKQDKTIVEHVHVLEEAKRVTDKELATAQEELKKNATYIRSLEKAKNRLIGEAEDLARETERERMELKSKEKAAKTQEDRVTRAVAEVENERKAKETAELQSRKLHTELLHTQHIVDDLTQQLKLSKDNLDIQLRKPDDETIRSNAVSRMERDYQTKIAQLEIQLQDGKSANAIAAGIRERVEHQHAEIRQLVLNTNPVDEAFRSRLLRELQLADESLEKELSTRSQQLRENSAADFKALLSQQRNTQEELENQRVQVRELALSKKQLHVELTELRSQLEIAKKEGSDTKRKLQRILQEDKISSTTSSAVQSEMRTAIESYKAKEVHYQELLEAAEIARAKAARAESSVRRLLADAEKSQADAISERKLTEERLLKTERKLRELESKLEEDGRESSDMSIIQQRLAEELQDEREQHQKDLAERDFTTDQTRKKYQAELAQLSEELQSQRDTMSRLREDNRKIRSDYDELQLRFDDEVYNSGGWKKEKERMETKIGDVTKAYEVSTAAQAEQQSQIVSLHSQVRELRGVLNDAEADRALLQKARRALQAELETIKLDHVDTNKMSSDRELQMLQLKKQDLERSLEEQEDRVTNAFGRMKKAELYANECQVELGKVRVENSELDRLNAHLEKQVKELNVRIVDLETKSYASSPRPTAVSRRLESRIEELTSQLNQTNKDKSDTSRMQRSADKIARDAKFQLAESDRQRSRLEEERKNYESQILNLRQAMDAMQTEESSLQAAKRRAEREAVDFKQKALNLEREVERLRSRLDRPASAMLDHGSSSATSQSPRK